MHGDLAIDYNVDREETRKTAFIISDYHKNRTKHRHDLGIRAQRIFSQGQLVMLWGEKTAGRKLSPTWRGPFIVSKFGGGVGKSYTIRQNDGTRIPRKCYGDHLKHLSFRQGYLVTRDEEKIPVYQNFTLGNAALKLPKSVRAVPRAHTRLEKKSLKENRD